MKNEILELLYKAKLDDKDSQVILYKKFSKSIIKLSKIANYEEAETDLVIFFLEFIKKIDLDKFRYQDKGELIIYIYKSLKNHSLNLKKKNIRKNIEITCIEIESICYDFYKNLELENIYLLIKKLTPIQKEIIIGLYVYEYSVAELSTIFKISRQAINQSKNKALKLLKDELLNKNKEGDKVG